MHDTGLISRLVNTLLKARYLFSFSSQCFEHLNTAIVGPIKAQKNTIYFKEYAFCTWNEVYVKIRHDKNTVTKTEN